MMKRPVIFALVILLCLPGTAREKTVIDAVTYTYYASGEEMSVAQAKQNAVEQAKCEMIARHFGTTVGSVTTSIVNNSDNKNLSSFFSYGQTEVNGEWVRTIGAPVFEPLRIENNLFVVTVHIKGEIREIETARTPVLMQTLRGGTEEANAGDTFQEGDDFYMSFQSPIDGYIAVYLFPYGEKVQRLLPYDGKEGSFKVKGGTRHVLFAECRNNVQSSRYEMQCDGQEQYHKVYVIFSPEPFVHANDSARENTQGGKMQFPNELEFEKFQKWLSQVRRQDRDMVVVSSLVVVRKKQ